MVLTLLVAALTALVPAAARAQGGPPLLTDDPDTPGPGYWEINVAMLVETGPLGRRVETPRIDLNYGVGRRIQLKFEVPWVAVKGTDETDNRTGLGNSVVGVKWRFLGQEGQKIAWSTYPQFQFNTVRSSITKGLVEEGSSTLVPTEITLEMAHVEINVEVGRIFAGHGAGGWIYGVSTEAAVLPRLELLAEIHGEQTSAGENPTELVANIGARETLTGQLKLMIAAGRHLRGMTEPAGRFMLYVGVQFNLPGVFTFGQIDRGRR